MRTKLWSACAVALGTASSLLGTSGLSAQPAPLTPGETVVVTWRDRVDSGLSTGVLLGAPVGALVAWAASRSRGIYEDVPFPDLRVRRAAASGRAHLDLLGRLTVP
jgi:hypothetical protein